MDVLALVETVCASLQKGDRARELWVGAPAQTAPYKQSRYTVVNDALWSLVDSQELERKAAAAVLQYWEEVNPLLHQFHALQNIPVQWRTRDTSTDGRCTAQTVLQQIWTISEQYCPAAFTTRELESSRSCPGVLRSYPVSSLAPSPMSGGAPGGRLLSPVPPPPLSSEDTAVPLDDDEGPLSSARAPIPPEGTNVQHSLPVVSIGNHGTIYQRRAHFKLTMSIYQSACSLPHPANRRPQPGEAHATRPRGGGARGGGPSIGHSAPPGRSKCRPS